MEARLRREPVFSAEKEGNSSVQCEVKQKMPKFVGKMAGRGKKMLFLCRCVAGRMAKSFLLVPFSLTQVITRQSMLFLRKKKSLSFTLKMSKQNVLAFLK